MRPSTTLAFVCVLSIGCGLRARIILDDASTAKVPTDHASLELLDEAWERGSVSRGHMHGNVLAEHRCVTTDHRGNFTLKRTQRFAGGLVVYREMTATPQHDVLAVALDDTHADGTRTGFRIHGVLHPWELPTALAGSLSHLFGEPR